MCIVPSGLFTNNILTDRATLNWGANGAVYYNIRYRVQGNTTWTYLNFAYGNYFTKYNLLSGTNYEWEIQSMCAQTMLSTPPWSATQTFSTWEDCSIAPNNTISDNITLYSADISWSSTPNAVGYIVRFKENAASWGSWIYDTLSTTSLSKSSLNSNTGYQWQVKAYCNVEASNFSQWSSNDNFVTLSDCADPTNLTVPGYTLGISNATLNWKGTNGADHYVVVLKDVNVSVWDTLTVTGSSVTLISSFSLGFSGSATTSGPNVSLSLVGMYGGTTYEWQVMTSCNSGGINNSAYVSGINFTTDQPCTVPNNFSATNILTDRATMNWSSTSSSNDHYDVRLREQGGSWLDLFYIFNTSQTKYSLTPGIIYEWQVRGVCSYDTSSVSNW